MPVATDKALDGFGRYAGPATLILASLADGIKHGYALTRDIESFAGVRVAPGTLYEALARLQARGLIEPVESDNRHTFTGSPRSARPPAGPARRAAPRRRCRAAPPGSGLGPGVSGPREPCRGLAPLVPASLAGPLRRGVCRVAARRPRRAAEVGGADGGRDQGRLRRQARRRRAVRLRAAGPGASPRAGARPAWPRSPVARPSSSVSAVPSGVLARHRLAVVRAYHRGHRRGHVRDDRNGPGPRPADAARRAAGGVDRGDSARGRSGPAAWPSRPRCSSPAW